MQISLTCPNPTCAEDLVFSPGPQRGGRLQTRCGGCGEAWSLAGGELRRLGAAVRPAVREGAGSQGEYDLRAAV